MRTVLGGRGVSPWGGFWRLQCALAALIALAAIPPALAQSYKSIPPSIPEKEAKAMFIKVSGALRDPAGFGAQEQTVQDYFMKYFFPKMTQFTPADLAELGKSREILFSRYIRVMPNADSRQKLSEWSLKVARALTQGNYHPAVRYNAALILGNLDQQVAGPGTPPVPLPEATAILLDLLEQSDFGGVPVHPSVKLGALVGLERHAQFGVSPQHAERVVNVALDIIAQDAPPEDVSKGIHQWMKCQSASVLAWQTRENPDAKSKVVAALNTLLADEAFDLDNRTYVAGLLKRMKLEQSAGLDVPAATTAIGKLALDVMEQERKLAAKYQEDLLGNGNIAFNPRGGRGFGVGDEQLGPKYERRRLVSRLSGLADGASALKAGVPADAQAKLDDLLAAIGPPREIATEKNSSDVGVVEEVLNSADRVNQVVGGWKAAAAAANDRADADFATALAE